MAKDECLAVRGQILVSDAQSAETKPCLNLGLIRVNGSDILECISSCYLIRWWSRRDASKVGGIFSI